MIKIFATSKIFADRNWGHGSSLLRIANAVTDLAGYAENKVYWINLKQHLPKN